MHQYGARTSGLCSMHQYMLAATHLESTFAEKALSPGRLRVEYEPATCPCSKEG